MSPTAYLSQSQKSSELNLDAVKNKSSLGMHIGTRVQLGTVGVDLSYEKGFSAVESQVLSQAGVTTDGQIDSRTNQFTLGVSFKIN